MARKRIVGFETGAATDEQVALTGTASIQSTTKRTGDYALKVNPADATTGYCDIRGIDANGNLADFNLADGYVRFYVRFVTFPTSGVTLLCIFQAIGAASNVGYLQLTAARALHLINSAGSTVFTGSTLTTGVWYRIEMRLQVGASGAYEVKLDGNTESSGTSNFGTTNGFRFLFGITNTGQKAQEYYYDDIAIDDAAFPGPGQIVRLDPSGAGYASWPTGAYTGVDDYNAAAGNDGDTTVVEKSTSGTGVEAVALEDLSALVPAATIAATEAVVVARRNNASASAFSIGTRGGSTDALLGSLDIATFQARHHIRTTDPSTGAAWTLSGVDAAQVIISKDSSQARAVRATAMALMVEYVGAYSLVPDVGSYAETGSTVNLKAARKLTLDAGAYAETGTAVNLRKGYTFGVLAGAYAEVGSAAGLLAARKIIPGAGSYALTGATVMLRAARLLALAAGSYSYTGTAVGLAAARKIVPGAGDYSLSGTVAGLLAARLLAPGAGSYAVSGSSVNLLRSLRLVLGAGAYVETGADAVLLAARLIVVGSGDYAVSGANAALLRALILAAGAGGFVISGADADLIYTPSTGYILVVDAGAFSLSGTDAALLVGRAVAAGAGAYALDGTAATLLATRRISPAAGTFAVAGSTAALLAARSLALAEGSYALAGTATRLLRGLKAAAGSGTFTLTGSDARFLRALIFHVGAGAVSLTGANARLLWGHLAAAGAGTYELTGEEVLLLVGRRLAADAGAYLVTGADVDLFVTVHAFKLVALPGSFVVTGSPVGLTLWPLVVELGRVATVEAVLRAARVEAMTRSVAGGSPTQRSATFVEPVVRVAEIEPMTRTVHP